jgi:two-component system invasion response regulator UvrY
VTRILIADDHAILRRGLCEILQREMEDVTCGEAGDARQIMDQVQNHPWDLLILDLTMPGPSGIEVLASLQRQHKQLPVLVLTMHPEDQYAKRVLKAGACGYMNKESAPEDLIKAIRKLLAGGRYVSPTLAEQLAVDLRDGDGQPAHESLSDREFEILRMIASGKSVGQISRELHLAVTTISTYRARILEKMKLTSTADLIRYALQNRLA